MMTTYIVRGEALNRAQGWFTEHIGNVIWLDPTDETGGMIDKHGMRAVIDALLARREFDHFEGCE